MLIGIFSKWYSPQYTQYLRTYCPVSKLIVNDRLIDIYCQRNALIESLAGLYYNDFNSFQKY